MLVELFIQDIAIIHQLRIPFHKGFSAITGETGAGKSIILGALQLVLGERVKGDLLSDQAEKGTIEALFELGSNRSVLSLLHEYGIELEAGEPLMLRRELSRQGTHRNYVNNRSVPLSVLKELGNRLIDFHGQHDHQSLFYPEEQLNLLDQYAAALDVRERVEKGFAEKKKLAAQLEELRKVDLEKKERMEFLSFQIEEIAKANLKEEEEDALDQEQNVLAHSEKIREALTVSGNALSEGEPAATALIGEALKQLHEVRDVHSDYQDLFQRLESVQIELTEIAADLQGRLADLDADPTRLAAVEERLSLIWRLKKKYGGSLKEVLDYLKEQTRKLEELESASEKIELLEAQVSQKEELLAEEAKKLSRLRKKAAPKLEKQIESELQQLGMKNCQFQISFKEQEIQAKGAEQIEFLIAPNLGDSPKPLRSIASGGEISRLMLALKVVFSSESSVPTMIFDEIDVNLGGGVAVIVGKKIEQLAQAKQVLVITHLPQVASRADQNYKVEKGDVGKRTQTSIKELSAKEKTYEIARMLRGEEVTALALEHAKELIGEK